MDINWFDNYEEDGQLSLFSVGEDIEDLRESEPKEKNISENGKEVLPAAPAFVYRDAVAAVSFFL